MKYMPPQDLRAIIRIIFKIIHREVGDEKFMQIEKEIQREIHKYYTGIRR